MDFTLQTYRRLLHVFLETGYYFMTFEDYCKLVQTGITSVWPRKYVILRHDVDELANNALKFARIEKELGIKATYYFRIVDQSNRPDVIREITRLGHEIVYHYEDLAFAHGDLQEAKRTFENHLAYFRSFYPVQTVCMHGSSTSKYDNKKIFQSFPLSDFNLIGEPYISTDFTKVFYLTDTGYAWDGGKYAARDIVENHFEKSFHTTKQVISVIQSGMFPQCCLMLAHTLWTDNIWQWFGLHLREFVRNRVKVLARRSKFISMIYARLVSLYWTKKT